MILKNYMIAKERLLNATVSSSITMLEAYTDMSGTARSGEYGNYAPLGTALAACVGTGDTAPTATDYALEADASASFSNLTLSAATRAIAVDEDGKAYISHTHTISGVNNSGASVTIKEIGIYYKNWHYASGSYYCDLLFAREVLPEPVIVTAGDSFSLPIDWREY